MLTSHLTRPLLAFGLLAFLLAALSILDMYLPRPYDGVVLEADAQQELIVRQVVPGSGADRAGIRPGDRIEGIGRELLGSLEDAADQIRAHDIGDMVPYFVRSGGEAREVSVQLGRRTVGDPNYLYACLLGGSFFFVGLFVLFRQPRLRASQVFFLLCTLFMLFLICRLRPVSYSRVDSLVLHTGTAALLFLPATFLHFFLIFPRPLWHYLPHPSPTGGAPVRLHRVLLTGVYLLPPVVLALNEWVHDEASVRLISGAPLANWWVLAAYILLGLAALGVNATRLPEARERRGAALVLGGSIFGLVPFLVLAVGFPSLLHTEKFLFYGVIPLVLVPLTFAYAIVRYELLDIRVILRKSLLYTTTTAVVTGLYALGIASFNGLFRGTELASSPWFFVVFALAIVLLFEPLRQRIQGPVDRFFFAERVELQRTMMEMGEAFIAQDDLATVVRELVERLPRLLGLRFAALYLLEGDRFRRVEGPEELPEELPDVGALHHQLETRGNLARLDQMEAAAFRSAEAARLLHELAAAGVEVMADLASPRRRIGIVLLSGRSGQISFEREEMDLMRGLFHQAAIALETNLLLVERTRQAELERELEIAASIQSSLLPSRVSLSSDWEVAVACRPARHVGGDFIAELPGVNGTDHALAYGDVSGKSVSGALVMMAAYEILNTLAMTASDPEELLRLANQRLYRLGKKSFVALSYLMPSGKGLAYLLAGQPPLLKRCASGAVEELPMPEHRIPLGGLPFGDYHCLEVPVAHGELVLGYSDGVVEARSPGGEFFGLDRLMEIVRTAPPEPGPVIDQVLEAIDDFSRGDDPYDDLTLVALGRQPERQR